MSTSVRLPFDEAAPVEDPRVQRDLDSRERAVDPHFNVALEASAGTGKTRVLVDRYVNLLRAGVDPSNILAITFTRKAATEMRDRILATLRQAADRGEIASSRWRELRSRTADITISTIDAFCLSLLREFPLEADLDPGFSMADEMEVPRLVEEALDRALRTCRALAREDEAVALVFAQLGERRARAGLAALLNRRIVAAAVLERFLTHGPSDLRVAAAAARAAAALVSVFRGMPGGLDRFVETGPPEAPFVLLAGRLVDLERSVDEHLPVDPAAAHAAYAAARDYFLTQDGKPRARLTVARAQFVSAAAWQAHRDLVVGRAADVLRLWQAFRRDLNVIVSRGVRRMFAVAETEYRRTLDAHGVLDFHDVLLHTLRLLRQMEEFAQSRYRLEARYHHVLVDEFQDTSRAQWELVELLIASWGEGAGLAHTGPLQPSVFIVGDRKQSIYGFRDADVSVLSEASRHLEGLRPEGDVRRSISRSFRSVPPLLAFVNDVCQAMDAAPPRRDAFRYEESDRFPIETSDPAPGNVLGLIPGETPEACAERVANEIESLIRSGETIRDRRTGVRRPISPGDVAILFRTRDSHREFEQALERRSLPAYVYKGLGFFDADEVKDVLALLRYLADPASNLRAAAFLRSGFGRLSDEALRRLAPDLAEVLDASAEDIVSTLELPDRAALDILRRSVARWCALVDRLPPAELLDLVLQESAYAMELRGRRTPSARENLKKMRAVIRRIQNRGYATMGRIAAHLDRLAVGDEPNAVIDALDAVNLMTVHAAKGLEFPVVFVVNLARGTGNRRDPIRLNGAAPDDDISVAVGDYQSDDNDDAAREREESKRLLYVALTRARDRLYLSSALKNGALQCGRGSLADVLPASLIAAFAEPAADIEHVAWAGGSAVHTFRVVRGCMDRSREAVAPHDSWSMGESDFGRVENAGVTRESVGDLITTPSGPRSARQSERSSGVLVGLLVHRLLQRFGVTAAVSHEALLAAARHLAARLDAEDAAADAGVIADAIERFHAVRCHPTLGPLFDGGEVFHEVPFTLWLDARIVRGTIDCLVRRPDGSVHVVEFKTGRFSAEHARQLELYRQAAAALFPGSPIGADVIYPMDLDRGAARSQI